MPFTQKSQKLKKENELRIGVGGIDLDAELTTSNIGENSSVDHIWPLRLQ